MLQTNYTSYKYNPDEINEKEFLEKFVIRNDIFEDIFEDIKSVDFDVPNQHYIIVGQRGQGKTSLLRRISIAIKDDKKLSKFMIPVKFSEEQYQIRSLCRFFEVIAEELQENSNNVFPDILDRLENHIDDEDYEAKCFEYFEAMIKKQNKKLIVLSDNIDELLGKLKEKEQRQLRQILITSSTIRIIGASTKMIEQHFDYAKPFYEYFKIIKLDGLDYEDTIKFLRVIGDTEQNKKIEEIIQTTPERIETLRQLTGGVPRTLVMLYDIFVKNNETAFEDLMKILDEVTLLYKDRMDNLPSTLQDIVHNIAINWDGIATKELAKKTRLDSKTTSSQLKQLEKYHIIEFETIGKNKIYKIKERFFNIWYLMRFGRKRDRNKVEWLVKFLTSWYSRDELNAKAKGLIGSIKAKSLNENYVYHMCEGLSYSGLDLEVEHKMKQGIREYLGKHKSKLKNDLSKSDLEILNEANTLYKNGAYYDAIQILKKSQKSSHEILFVLALLYSKTKEYEKAEEYYLKAIENGNQEALFNLGILYYETKKYERAEEYYLKAIESGSQDAISRLANLYNHLEDYAKAENYYLKAIENGNNDAFLRLAIIYGLKEEYEKAEKYCLKAIDNEVKYAFYVLGVLYENKKDYKKAEEYYLKALEDKDSDALGGLARVYNKLKEYEKAEKYYLKAIENGNKKAIQDIAYFYGELKQYKKAEEYYLKAIEDKDNDALNGLSWYYFEQSKKIKEAVDLIKQSYKKEQNFYNTHTFAVIMLWNEELEDSYSSFLQWLEYEDALESENDITIYLNLLISKGLLYKAKEFLEMPKYQLKDRYKPIWYALMSLMKEDFPTEIKKMGSELKQSVGEVLNKIELYKEKYAI